MFIRLLLILLLPSALFAQEEIEIPPFTQEVSVSIVNLYASVRDEKGRPVHALEQEDFSLFVDGKRQTITNFSSDITEPVNLAILMDVSGSMAGNLRLLQGACDQLFARLRPDDLARVGTFGREITISPTFTRDAAALRAAVPVEISPDAPTPLWKALDEAMRAFAGVEGRHVVLVLSDGKDGAPGKFGERFVGELEIVDRAQRQEVMIYAVGLRSRGAPGRMPAPGGNLGAMLAADLPDPSLGTVALATGGGYFEIRPRDDLGAAFARVADELHSQYLMGFSPPVRDGKQHKIEVRVSGSGLEPRARKNYHAPKESK